VSDPPPPLSEPPADPALALKPALEARLGTVEHRSAAAQVVARSQTQDDDDRSWIARQIIYVFVGAVSAVLLLLLVDGLASHGESWSLVADRAADLIKTAVLPVVTLVLGYYFGKSGKG